MNTKMDRAANVKKKLLGKLSTKLSLKKNCIKNITIKFIQIMMPAEVTVIGLPNLFDLSIKPILFAIFKKKLKRIKLLIKSIIK